MGNTPYTVRLRVTDNGGLTDDTECTVYVGPTYYVDPNGNDANDGLSWATAFETIQRGIDEVNDGWGVVEVNEGTYYETIDFNGIECTLRSTNPDDWEVVENTIIDANGSGSVVRFNSGENADTILTGFTITGGHRGIYCSDASPAISNCIITDNNNPAGNGGGIYDSNSSLVVFNFNSSFYPL